MVQGDPDCEMIENEIDWGRLLKFILLELEAQTPIPLDERYLTKKGFNLKKRPISLTLNVLHNFIELLHNFKSTVHREEKRREEKRREDSDLDAPIIYLNKKAKRMFDPKNKSNQDLVKARYNEGRSLDDFKKVIDNKVAQWLTNDKMMAYLRPSTLFNRTNFENYLNEPVSVNTKIDELMR